METDTDRYIREQEALGVVLIQVENVLDDYSRHLIGRTVQVAFGDRFEKHTRNGYYVWVFDPDNPQIRQRLRMPVCGKIVQGKYKQIYFAGGIFHGTYGPMGAVGKGIRSGRAFRGR